MMEFKFSFVAIIIFATIFLDANTVSSLSLYAKMALPHTSVNDTIQTGALDLRYGKGYVVIYTPPFSVLNMHSDLQTDGCEELLKDQNTKIFRFTLSPLGFNDSADYRFALPKVELANGMLVDSNRSRLYVYGVSGSKYCALFARPY